MKKLITLLVILILALLLMVYNTMCLSMTNSQLEKKIDILEKQNEDMQYQWKLYTQGVVTISG